MSHQIISFIKSAIRIAGYVCLWWNPPLAVVILVFSELIGIYEEIGH